MKKQVYNEKTNKKYISVHYASSSINDSCPSISSISTYDLQTEVVKTFAIETNLKNDELFILKEFFTYINKKLLEGYTLLGWYWSDKYGIIALKQRYKLLTKKSPKLKANIAILDLIKIISKSHSNFFGGLKGIAKFNGLDLTNFVDGRDEIKLLSDKKFNTIIKSTNAKAKIIGELYNMHLKKTLQIPTLDEIFYEYKDLGAFPIFKENMQKINKLIETKNLHVIDIDTQEFIRNLLYANVITSMETYLADTFIRTVVKEKKYLEKYITLSGRFKDSTKKSEHYSELFKEAQKSNMTVERYLINKCIQDMRDITFHNISTADKLYKNVLGISFPNKIGHIYKAVDKRHDIVHRNGKNKDDRPIDIQLPELKKLITDVTKFVNYVHQEKEKLDGK